MTGYCQFSVTCLCVLQSQAWPEIYGASEWKDKSLQYYWEGRGVQVIKMREFDSVAFQTTFDMMDY